MAEDKETRNPSVCLLAPNSNKTQLSRSTSWIVSNILPLIRDVRYSSIPFISTTRFPSYDVCVVGSCEFKNCSSCVISPAWMSFATSSNYSYTCSQSIQNGILLHSTIDQRNQTSTASTGIIFNSSGWTANASTWKSLSVKRIVMIGAKESLKFEFCFCFWVLVLE